MNAAGIGSLPGAEGCAWYHHDTGGSMVEVSIERPVASELQNGIGCCWIEVVFDRGTPRISAARSGCSNEPESAIDLIFDKNSIAETCEPDGTFAGFGISTSAAKACVARNRAKPKTLAATSFRTVTTDSKFRYPETAGRERLLMAGTSL